MANGLFLIGFMTKNDVTVMHVTGSQNVQSQYLG